MNLTRKLALALVTAVLGLGVVAMPAPAHADSSWGFRVGK
jgi:hypothetical protein